MTDPHPAPAVVHIWLMSPEGAKPWDNLGMLQFAAMQEQAAVLRWDAEGDDE